MAQCAPTWTLCPQDGLPSNFCCSLGTTCVVVANKTTVLCCPDGSSCESIHPIACDLSQQNPSIYPNAPLKTTLLDSTLPQCKEKCCPFGFLCGDDGNCTMGLDNNSLSYSIGPTPSSATVPSSSATVLSSSLSLEITFPPLELTWSISIPLTTLPSSSPTSSSSSSPTSSSSSSPTSSSSSSPTSSSSSSPTSSSSSPPTSSSSPSPSSILSFSSSSTSIASTPAPGPPTGTPVPNPSGGLSTRAKVAITLGAAFGVVLILMVIFLGYRLNQVTKQEKDKKSVSEEKSETQPQLRISELWRRLVAVELPTTERPREVQGAEVIRLSGLHELDGCPKKRQDEVKSWFSWSTR
ncbi:hypothetical protein HD806DRAFT_509830 [Xylariaceae sp. AK1471]|nr:hypothetical protein HD806DRAFT_509830 [Xylariaceae sp. AK1471]